MRDVPNHFCVILDKTSFLKQNCLGSMGKFRIKITVKVRGYCSIKEMPIVYM